MPKGSLYCRIFKNVFELKVARVGARFRYRVIMDYELIFMFLTKPISLDKLADLTNALRCFAAIPLYCYNDCKGINKLSDQYNKLA